MYAKYLGIIEATSLKNSRRSAPLKQRSSQRYSSKEGVALFFLVIFAHISLNTHQAVRHKTRF